MMRTFRFPEGSWGGGCGHPGLLPCRCHDNGAIERENWCIAVEVTGESEEHAKSWESKTREEPCLGKHPDHCRTCQLPPKVTAILRELVNVIGGSKIYLKAFAGVSFAEW